MPTIKPHDGTGDPENHVRTFPNALLLEPISDALKCRAFPQILGGMAQHWYIRLPPNSVGSFKDLNKAFIAQCVSGKTLEKSSASLMNLGQRKDGSPRDYLNIFMKEAQRVQDLDEQVTMVVLQQRTMDVYFKRSLAKHPPENMNMLQCRAGRYIKSKESMKREAMTGNNGNNDNSKKWKAEPEYDARDKYPRNGKDSDSVPRKSQGPRVECSKEPNLDGHRERQGPKMAEANKGRISP